MAVKAFESNSGLSFGVPDLDNLPQVRKRILELQTDIAGRSADLIRPDKSEDPVRQSEEGEVAPDPRGSRASSADVDSAIDHQTSSTSGSRLPTIGAIVSGLVIFWILRKTVFRRTSR